MKMGKSRFQRYWANIDNCPGSLDHATREQIAEVKRMVKAAFHAGHGEYRKRIAELEEELEDTHACLSGQTDRAVQAEARLETALRDCKELEAEVKSLEKTQANDKRALEAKIEGVMNLPTYDGYLVPNDVYNLLGDEDE
jgi:chromosome segregation ATPase